jgi:phage gpG-like protein
MDWYLSGLDEFDNLVMAFNGMAEEGEDMRDPLRQVALYVQDTVWEQFLTEGDRSGGWIALTTRYREWKEDRVGDMPILQLTTDMFEAAISGSAVREISDDEVAYVIDDEKASWHQYGAERSKGGDLPPRPLVELHPPDYEHMEGILEDWYADMMQEELAEHGLIWGPDHPNWRPRGTGGRFTSG